MEIAIVAGACLFFACVGFGVAAFMTAGRVADLEAELAELYAAERKRVEQRDKALAKAQAVNRARRAV